MPVSQNLTDQQYGRLIVINRTGKDKWGSILWLCQCECGKTTSITSSSLTSGKTNSCGCLRKELLASKFTTHGHTRGRKYSRIYRIWASINQRCNNPNDKDFHHYGGRGITVCQRWRTFTNFLTDMGKPPANYQIDRINNDGPYCLDNCHWTTRGEQARNKRTNRLLTLNEKTQCITDWCQELGIHRSTLSYRLKNKWSIKDALTKPVRKPKTAFGKIKRRKR